MEKTLNTLLGAIEATHIQGSVQKPICDVVCDSRAVTKGALFIAVNGVDVDGHRFIPQAIEKGAAAVVCQTLPEQLDPQVTYITVPDSTIALAQLADCWWDHPSSKLKLVGVTGTNGKTTTATLLYELVEKLGHKAGLLSTVKNIVHLTSYEAKQTTPDHLTLNRLLHEMVEAGCEYAFMEVSSHACVQRRIHGIKFAGGVFTNLTRDHLDFHKTVDNYINAKKMFFDDMSSQAFALVNADDKTGPVMLQNTRASKYFYSLRSLADFRARIIEERIDGTLLQIDNHEVEVMFTGRFNAYNLLAVYGTAILLGFDKQEVLVALSTLKPVSGRFETLRSPRGYIAIVDYAHTPDALVNVLDAIAEVNTRHGDIITVCGCGGNRDAGKRPIMAREAAARSDKLILTSDNPRNEDPDEILRQMEVGLSPEDLARTLTITDRRQGIKAACQLAKAGDVVLVAGKGHETYQEIQGVRHHFDDCEVLREIFKNEQ
ncbi:MAG: UDP-N-acetylmuramoyl-L-alanyl-D-glutamate--2,6-diaminopimelate ligase [Muribaculaceae bacterium]|nr:UDP-N-acetylmuramoyl-L-alanyl-D-glutamate--2,6-diaminopimelate ligase [Muribaculaceae bacterium]